MAYSPTLRHLQISGDVFTAALMNAIKITEATGDVVISSSMIIGGVSAVLGRLVIRHNDTNAAFAISDNSDVRRVRFDSTYGLLFSNSSGVDTASISNAGAATFTTLAASGSTTPHLSLTGDTAGAVALFRQSGGTVASPTATQSGNIIANIQIRGYVDSAYAGNSGYIFGVANQNWTTGARGTRWEIGVNADGATVPFTVATFSGTGLAVTGNVVVNAGNDLQLYNVAGNAYWQIYNSAGSGAANATFRYSGVNYMTVSSTGVTMAVPLTLLASTTTSGLLLGGMEMQSYAVNNEWLGSNTYFDGSVFRTRATGYTQQVYFNTSGNIALFLSTSQVAGTDLTAYRTKVAEFSLTGLAVTGTTTSTGKIASTVASGNFGLQVESGARIAIDGGGNTYIYEGAADVINFSIGGVSGIAMSYASTSSVNFTVNGAIRCQYYNDSADLGLLLFGNTTNNYIYFNGTNVYHRVGGNDTLVVSSSILGVNTASTTCAGSAVLGVNIGGNSLASSLGLGINSTSDSGTQYFVGFGRNGSICGQIYSTGTNSTTYATSSDARLKDSVQDFTNSGELIDKLRPRVWKWKKDGSFGLGFIAQEEHRADPIFQKIGAILVGDNNSEKITSQWMRSDQALIPILVAELKSLRARLAVLESKN